MNSEEYGFWRKWILRVICVELVVGLLIGIQMPVKAAQSSNEGNQTETVLRVAYCPLEGFFDYDNQGNEVGYGVELLDKISQYTGIRFEYVKTDSWEKTKYMLLNGEADIRMPGTMPATPSTTLAYSSTGILDTYEVMLTLNSREDLYYQDYDTIHALKIAITDSFFQAEEVEKYLEDIGISESQLVFFSEYNECYEQLKQGNVDALITNIMDMSDDMKMLARFNSISNYISMILDSPYMNTINDAIAEIKLDEPMFLSNLYEKWFPERTTVPLTLEEIRYLSSLDTLTFAFRENEGYLSHCRDGEYYGIYVDQAKLLCEKLGKQFRAVSIDDCLNGLETADVYAGFFYDRNYAKNWNFGISAPVKDINYYIIQKKEKNFDPASSRIAAIQKFRYTSDYLEKQYPDADFQYYDTYEDCLKAVEAGKADMTIINNYIAEYYLGMYQFSDLSVQLSNDYSHMFCFATSDNDQVLASILTKGLSMITDTGIGMSEEFQEHMFEPFSQENQVVTPVGVGTGLGLTIVKRMCDLMHMTIAVSSKLGVGTTFTLTGEYELAVEESEDQKSSILEESTLDEMKLENHMILVCEDHPLNQEIIRRILEKKGMIVTIAEDGKNGIEAFSQSAIGTYAAILMDIRMPVMDGLEATKEIRGLQRSDAKSIPIIDIKCKKGIDNTNNQEYYQFIQSIAR